MRDRLEREDAWLVAGGQRNGQLGEALAEGDVQGPEIERTETLLQLLFI